MVFISAVQSSYQEVDIFKELHGGTNFDTVFGQNTAQNSFPASSAPLTNNSTLGGVPAMGDMLTPQAVDSHAAVAAQERKLAQEEPLKLTTDVNSSLARAAANLCEFFLPCSDEGWVYFTQCCN